MAPAIPNPVAPGFLAGAYAEFDRCWPWLEAALQRGGNRHTRETLWAGITSGQFQFWPCARAAGVTQVIPYPTGAVCILWLVGGELDDVLAHEPDVAAWATAIGCVALQLVGRRGWDRVLSPLGYDAGDLTMTRRLDHGSAGGGCTGGDRA